MPFQIPNTADAAFPAQAAPDKVDLDILVAGIGGDGVITGCAVTAQGSPDMTLAVAAGTVRIAGTMATVASGNVTITTANATNPRLDLVVVNNAGTKSVTAGTAAASPVFPAIPASSVVLAAVWVPANDTAIGSTQIVDKRVSLADWSGRELGYAQVTSNLTTTAVSAATATDATGLIITVTVGTRPIIVEFWALVWAAIADRGVAVSIVEAAAGDANRTPVLALAVSTSSAASAINPCVNRVRLAPSAGSHTYKIQFNSTTGAATTATIGGAATFPAFIRAYEA